MLVPRPGMKEAGRLLLLDTQLKGTKTRSRSDTILMQFLKTKLNAGEKNL